MSYVFFLFLFFDLFFPCSFPQCSIREREEIKTADHDNDDEDEDGYVKRDSFFLLIGHIFF